MTTPVSQQKPASTPIRLERTFLRFTVSQRWEHAVVLLCVLVQLLTGLPQKYQQTGISQWIISTPERLNQIQTVHHVFALLLCAIVLYHLGKGIVLLAKRRLPEAIFPTWEDFKDLCKMVKYLLFLSKEQPKAGKYNFEQKLTYWFVFFGIGILICSGLVLWFPLVITRVLPGGVVPAAFLAHSNEAVVLAVFIIVWHFYHVHFQRLNLSIFTGRVSEAEMLEYHPREHDRLTTEEAHKADNPGGNP